MGGTMLIPESITISGYKCFENVTIPLGNKITCLVGRNNSGKTSVIEVCKLLCTSFDYPEKNSMDGTQIDQQLLSETSPFLISLTFNIGSPAKFCPVLYSTVTKEHKLAGTEGIKILNEFNKPDCKIIFDIKYNSKSKMLLLDKIKINSVTLFQDSISSSFHMPWNTSSHFSYVHVSSGNRKQISLATSPLGEVSNLLPAFIKSIKFISVDRYIPTRVDNHNNTTENENLSATAKLLQYWSSSKRSKFNAIIRFLNSLDDSIGDLRFEPFNSSLILKFAKNMEQDSADVSLENCGSGIKQLLGMATFVLNDEADQYIIIDEPQAFLHPHAEELFVDLISLTKNNFLIATHSPVFINAASDGIVLLKKNNGISKAITNNNGTSLVKDIARELGTSAHQLVVAKGILFVEGETEVSILENITAQDNDLKSALKNYLVRSIPATGMVTGKGKPVTRDLLKDIQNSIGLNTIII